MDQQAKIKEGIDSASKKRQSRIIAKNLIPEGTLPQLYLNNSYKCLVLPCMKCNRDCDIVEYVDLFNEIKTWHHTP